MSTALPLSPKEPDRQARLNAWFALHGIEKRAVAERIGVTPQMLSEIITGKKAPRERIEQLVALGIPRELLPEPWPDRRKRENKTTSDEADEDVAHAA